jgi:hypothetical protein
MTSVVFHMIQVKGIPFRVIMLMIKMQFAEHIFFKVHSNHMHMLMWALPFGYPTLIYLLWHNRGPTTFTAAQDGPIRRLQQWKDGRRQILDKQGKELSIKEKID